MRGREAQIQTALREAQTLAPDEHVAAAWSGYLIEVLPARQPIAVADRPTAVLCVTETSLYVLAGDLSMRATLDRVLGPSSPSPNVLRFTVHDDRGRVTITLAVRDAHVISRQLRDFKKRPPSSVPLRRPRAKQRPATEYVD